MVRPTSVMDVQVLLGDPKLTKLLIWEQQDDRVVAKPKYRLSRTAFQEILRKFRKRGYTSYVGFRVELRKKVHRKMTQESSPEKRGRKRV